MISEKWAKDRLAYWQQRLRLGDWDIRLVVRDLLVLETDAESELLAQVKMTYKDATAEITVAGKRTQRDVERSIIHELLHICLAPLEETMAVLFTGMGEGVARTHQEHLDRETERILTKLTEALVR